MAGWRIPIVGAAIGSTAGGCVSVAVWWFTDWLEALGYVAWVVGAVAGAIVARHFADPA